MLKIHKSSPKEGEDPMFKAVSLVPFGDVRQDVIDAIAGGIYENLGLEVLFEESQPLPSTLFDSDRGQFRGEDLVRHLRDSISTSSALKLGITAVDLYALGLDFVFGISILKQATSIISYHRLDNSFYHLSPNHRVLYERVVKESLHELGHAMGLEHCQSPCIMYYSNSVMEIDVKPARFCSSCAGRINLVLGRI